MLKKSTHLLWALKIMIGITISVSADCALAQNITLDGTLGTAETLPGPDYTIPQAVGQTVDNNLFHSFGRFGLDAGESANFQSASNIRNIFSRVTGGNPSNINGSIFTESPGINLFLINPSGIIFGSNARLNVGGISRGSFVATTADALVWSNGGQFSAVNPGGTSSLLTLVGDPSGFLASLRPLQPINISGSFLSVSNTQSLLFLGGDLNLDGASLQAPGGRIDLAGVAGTGIVGLNINANNLSLNLPENIVREDVSITNSSFLDVVSSRNGDIAIHAQNLDIFDSILRAGISSFFSDSSSRSGDITLNAAQTTRIANNSIVANAIFRGSAGNSGNINITTESLLVSDGSGVGTFVFGSGNAGNVVIRATDSFLLTGSRTIVSSTLAQGAEGQGGEINIHTGVLSLSNNAQIGAVTGGRGNAGRINIQADSVSLSGESTGILSNVAPGAEGRGGDIRLETRTLSLTDGTGISSSNIEGQGDAGNIFISATDSVSLSDSTITSRIDLVGRGNGGEINITTGSLFLNNAVIAADADGIGNAGNINIQADFVSLVEDSALFASSFGEGNAGNIFVQADNTLLLRDSSIFTTLGETGQGRGGDITIQAGSISLMETTNLVSQATSISSSTFGQGDSGNIQVRTTGDIVLVGTGGFISGVGVGAIGNGGDINIEARSLSLADGVQLFASTDGEGKAGDISVEVTDFVNISGVDTNGFSSGLLTNTESQASGQGGNIQVTTPKLKISNSGVLSAVTRSAFRGGNITVNTNTLDATSGGQILTSAFSSGDAGNISVNVSDRVTLSGSDPSFLTRLSQLGRVDPVISMSGLYANTANNSTGAGGSITVQANSFEAHNGGQVLTSTNGSGRAGNIFLRSKGILLEGSSSGLFANTSFDSVGQGGSITVTAEDLRVQDGASVNVSSPQSQAGNLTITAKNIFLNRGTLNAETALNRTDSGANITLQGLDFLFLQNNSRISAQANGSAQGGNITIDAPRGFIAAPLGQDNDIIASASFAQGGNIVINTQLIFGIAEGRAIPGNRTNDIDASSQFNTPGTVTINTTDLDPKQGLLDLPTNLIDASKLVASGCNADIAGSESSEFIIIGRGGLPPSPNEPLQNDVIWTDTRIRNSTGYQLSQPIHKGAFISETTQQPSSKNHRVAIVPATGWLFNNQGEVTLISNVSTNSVMETISHRCQ